MPGLRRGRILHFPGKENTMIRNASRGRLWKLTLLIWVGGGVFVFHRCSVETGKIRSQAIVLMTGMTAHYHRAAKRITADPGKKSVKMRMREVAMAHAEYLKKIGKLRKRLFWQNLFEKEEIAAALKRLDAARKTYSAALRQRRKK